MFKSFFTKFVLVAIFFVGITAGFVSAAFAEAIPASCSDAACRSKLMSDLAALEKEISVQTALVESKQREGVSLERDLAILTAQIAKAKLSISAATIKIAGLTESIGVKKVTITKYAAKIDREHESLGGFLRRINELDDYSTVAVALSDKNLSEFFSDLDNFQYIGDAVGQSLDVVGAAKRTTEEEKASLEEKKNKEADLRYQKELEKKFLSAREIEKAQVLKVTKGQEKAYQKVLQEKQARAASIRAALFALRDSGEIQFGQALEYANTVSRLTGIRPAFLLAIFMQESGFGKDQGSCYISDQTTGNGVGANTGEAKIRVMNPNRDISPFLDITSRVVRDPYKTRVSCWIPAYKNGEPYGWGGAMGAAQFIPSTWVLYENRITRALSIPAADPWRARDAFMAAGLLLIDNGARSGSYSAERNAACKYFSGASCSKSAWAATYGSQVMRKAETIQTTMIDPVENS